MSACPSCTFVNPPGSTTCQVCGSALPKPRSDGDSADFVVYEMLLHNLRNENAVFSLSSPVSFISQKYSYGSHWSCGYRNIQMLLSALNRNSLFSNALTQFEGRTLSISELQSLIERAWESGLDPTGAAQFSHHLLGKSSYIGSTECSTLLTHLSIPSQLVDFTDPLTLEDASNCLALTSSECLILWAVGYFNCKWAELDPAYWSSLFSSGNWNTSAMIDVMNSSSSSSSRKRKNDDDEVEIVNEEATGEFPLYLQHDGHSRSIVGIIRNKQKKVMKATSSIVMLKELIANVLLLVFDPVDTATDLVSSFDTYRWKCKLKRSVGALGRRRQYQVVYVRKDCSAVSRNLSSVRIVGSSS